MRGECGISFAQESTRYCNYSNEEKFGNEGIKISIPHWTNKDEIESSITNVTNYVDNVNNIFTQFLTYTLGHGYNEKIKIDNLYYWLAANQFCEYCYLKLIEGGLKPEDARGILPLDINSEMVMTAFVSDWKHFFDLRADGTTGKPHPDINKIAVKLKNEFKDKCLI